MVGSGLNALPLIESSQQRCDVENVIIPIFQKRKLRLTEVKQQDQFTQLGSGGAETQIQGFPSFHVFSF